jgi:hypothetical protein
VEKPASFDGAVSQVDPTGDSDGAPTFSSAEWTFDATQVQRGKLGYDLTSEGVDETFAMKDLTVAASVTHKQVERAVATEVFGQGSEQEAASIQFQQNENASGMLDILVVIDNSSSMEEEQLNLSTKLAPLLSYVEDSDWRIGVVTSDPDDGCLRGLINKGDRNAVQAFATAVRAGTSGSGVERGVLQAVNALKGDCNGGSSWLRPNSTVAVLMVTDEDNCSDGQKCNGAAWTYADYLLDYLNSIREVGVNARVYGLLWHPSEDQTQCPTGFRRAPIYADLVDRSQGTWGSICDNDYSATLSAVSQDLSSILKTQFALDYEPYRSTVRVKVDGVLQSSGYQLVGNVIEFSEAPAAGSTIEVDYQFTTDPPKKEVTLFGKPDSSSVNVYLDGEKTEDFTYVANSQTVSFDGAPMAREIKVVYRKPEPLQTAFAIDDKLNPASLEVSVNGQDVERSQYTYSAVDGKIHFNQPPDDGSKIAINYDQVVGPQLSYPAFVPADVGDQFEIRDAQTLELIPYELRDRRLVFPEGEYRQGRQVLVTYANPFQDAQVIDLGYQIIEDSIMVEDAAGNQCQPPVIDGSQIDLLNCGFSAGEQLTVNFDFINEHRQEFTLEEPGVELDERFEYKVFVNGEPTEAFRIEGQTLVVDEKLPLFATVTVKLFRTQDD